MPSNRLWDKVRKTSITVVWRTDIIDFEYHLNHLSGKKNLLFLAMKRFNDVLLFHIFKKKNYLDTRLLLLLHQLTSCAFAKTVDSKSRVIFCDLTRFNFG